jgi:hypothetical protein
MKNLEKIFKDHFDGVDTVAFSYTEKELYNQFIAQKAMIKNILFLNLDTSI